MKGYVQVYTGDGKGKTTAALGLAIRAAGAGLSVYIIQFIKMGEYSEIKMLEKFSESITIEQCGLGRFICDQPLPEDIEAAQRGLKRVQEAIASDKYQVIILEEANVAAKIGLISVQDILDVIDDKPDHVELVITGRYASPLIIERADLVTEMKAIKHYYEKGVQARVGIEK